MMSNELMDKTNSKYGMRAPPRRRIKTEDSDDQPVFLRKAFVMMSQCPPEIGGWSQRGDTVIIKDVKQFSEKIIPTAYKHNNFSSFVRQLNFYGFRKVKSEVLEQSTWWEFRHPQFQRDQPQLLSEIKRSIHYAPDPLNGQEVSDLKNHVHSLQDKIDMLSEQVEMLTNAVSEMRMGQDTISVAPSALGKKRKVTVKPVPDTVSFSRMCSIDESRAMVSGNSSLSLTVPSGQDLQGIFRQNSGGSCVSLSEMVAEGSADSKWGSEEDLYFLDDLLDMPMTPTTTSTTAAAATAASSVPIKAEPVYEELPMASAVPATATAPTVTASAASATGVQDLFSILESLSPELKIRFVDKLAEVMGNQLMNTATAAPASPVDRYRGSSSSSSSSASKSDAYSGEYNSKLPASGFSSSSSSSSSGSISPSRSFAQLTSGVDAPYHLPSGVRAPEIALPLASAALGAFVMSSLNSLTSQQLQSEKSRVHIKKEMV